MQKYWVLKEKWAYALCAGVVFLLAFIFIQWPASRARADELPEGKPAALPVKQIPEELVAQVVYVDGQSLGASDRNPGTEQLPFKSLTKAAKVAEENNKGNVGTKVVISPGIYREVISLAANGKETDAPIVFEARDTGSVTVSGSDVWSDWRQEPGDHVYSHSWPYKWGLAPYPSGWRPAVTLEPIVRRRELLFVNGKSLDQVLSAAELTEGAFYVSEEKGRVFIQLASGILPENSVIEVATRSGLFYAQKKRNVVLRGIKFSHDNTPVQGSAVRFVDSTEILVEDCEFLWNNWGGLEFSVSQGITARRNSATHNGALGFSGYRLKNVLFEENETSFNNWRGAKGRFYGWAVAGTKFGAIHDGVFRKFKSVGNQARGFWLDYDNANVWIEEARWCDNYSDGIFIEANQGPITIKNSVICESQNGAGVLGANSTYISLLGNAIYSNKAAQIRITGDFDRSVTNWETNQKLTLRIENWTLKDNVIVGVEEGQLLVDSPGWQHFLSSLTSERNLWFNSKNDDIFRVSGRNLNFGQWQNATGADLNSVFRSAE